MIVEVDKKSGFCFGVINAIREAETELAGTGNLFCLGDIVHNEKEVERLEKLGLKSITKDEFFKLKNCRVLIRAHGEPPETYEYAKQNNIELIDATCPVVITLQERVKKSFEAHAGENGQIVIYGKKGHAEIEGLNGQTNHNAIILESIAETDKIDMSRPVSLYSQTTKRVEDFHAIADKVKAAIDPGVKLEIKDTICRQVSNRVPHLREFAGKFDVLLFVSGKKSSNGLYLYTVCREVNPRTHLIAETDEMNKDWFIDAKSVGICGATSTPVWLMEEFAAWVIEQFGETV